MAVLVYLVQHAGEMVSRQELEQAVWRDTVVTYEALTVTINKIRAALEDDSRHPKFIETLAKRGYRLISPVYGQVVSTGHGTAALIAATEVRRKRNFSVVATGVTALLLLGGLAIYLAGQGKIADDDSAQAPAHLPALAVIPFTNISGDVGQDYFAAGMTECILTDLSRLSNPQVTARNSVLGFDSASDNIEEIAAALKVQYILTGSVARNAGKLHVNVQLFNALKGTQLWAERFDRELDDLFLVQDAISGNVVRTLVVKLSEEDQELRSKRYTANKQAYDYFMQGNALYTSITKEGNHLAREMYRKAIAIDPKFASAYSAIAQTYVDDYRRKWETDAGWEKEKVLLLDPEFSLSYWLQTQPYVTTEPITRLSQDLNAAGLPK